MSYEAVVSVGRSIAEVKEVLQSLTPQEWAMPSGCSGWSVRDLVAHMSSNYAEIIQPSPPPAEPLDLPAEAMMDLLVDARAEWTNQQVLDEYLQFCDAALAAFAAMRDEPVASTVIPLADLGEYPTHQLADAFAFDHYCHLRVDLLAPHGPIERSVSTVDDELLGPAVGWMLTGLPKMQPNLHNDLHGVIRLNLTGPGGGTWDIARVGDGIVVSSPSGDPGCTVTSSAHDFVIWGTARASWRDMCAVDGDTAIAAAFLDALNII